MKLIEVNRVQLFMLNIIIQYKSNSSVIILAMLLVSTYLIHYVDGVCFTDTINIFIPYD